MKLFKKKPNKMDSPVDEIFSVFLEKFKPANGMSDSDVQMTTQSIIETITDFYPDASVDSKYVFDRMKQAGYKYGFVIRQMMFYMNEK